MKRSIRLIALLLTLLLSASLLLACTGEEETTEAETNKEPISGGTNSSETETEERAGFEFVPDIAEKNYGGELILSVMGDSNKIEWHWAEKSEGDAMSESIYRRQESVRDHIGVEILGKRHTGDFGSYTEEYKTAVKNKDDSIHMIVSHVNLGITGLISGNYLRDLNQVEGLNLDADYWNRDVMETLSINDKMFLGKNQYNILYTFVVSYNKSMMDRYDDALDMSVYEMVDNYKWTLDQMISLAKTVSADTTSDGKTVDDTFGIAGRQWEPFAGFLQSSNISLMGINEAGEYVVTFYNDLNKSKTAALVDKIKDLTVSPNAWFWPLGDNIPTLDLSSNRVLMSLNSTNGLPGLTEYKDLSFGVLPYPMYDEEQKNVGYRHLQWGGYTCIPSYVADPEMVAEAVELLAYYSFDVNNTFYEKLIGKQAADAPDDRRMLGLIWDTICTDFGQTYSEAGSILYLVPQLTTEGTTENLSSYAASKINNVNKSMKKFVKSVMVLK